MALSTELQEALARSRSNPVGLIIRAPVGRHPTSRHHRLKRAGYTMFRVGRFPKLFPATVTMKMPSSYGAFTASAHACKNGRRELDLWPANGGARSLKL